MSNIMMLILKYAIGLLGIALVVVVHEIGHLVVAKFSGIGVEVFSFGLGPKVWGKEYKGTEFRLSLLPLGGFCRMKGSDDLSQALLKKSKSFTHTEDGSLFSVHPLKRMATYLAGPFLNILFAIFLYSILASTPYRVISTEPVIATINEYPTLFGGATSPAFESGLRTGDTVLALNETPIRDWEALEDLLLQSEGIQLFTVLRDSKEIIISVAGELTESGPRYGLSPAQKPIVGKVRPNTPEAEALLKTGDVIVQANGINISNDLDLLVALPLNTNQTTLIVSRDGTNTEISFRPNLDENGRGDWNFSLQGKNREVEAPPFSLQNGWHTTMNMARDTLYALLAIIQGESSDVRQEFTGMARAALMIGDIT
ncbi:MAG: RIP metalloprotease RseP, partial [Sphaerochaeta sp.]|nr:RIP metalloprotease RseP [Sphaerochaeta sp.]